MPHRVFMVVQVQGPGTEGGLFGAGLEGIRELKEGFGKVPAFGRIVDDRFMNVATASRSRPSFAKGRKAPFQCHQTSRENAHQTQEQASQLQVLFAAGVEEWLVVMMMMII